MANRFKDTEPTLQELSYLAQGMNGNFEAVLLFLESRLLDPKPNIREIPMSALMDLLNEMVVSLGEESVEPPLIEEEEVAELVM